MSEVERLARIIRQFLYVVWFLAVVAFLDGVWGPFDMLMKTDTTDAPGSRSGLRLYTDHMTGCEYLGTRNGLTPRLDNTGRQICG